LEVPLSQSVFPTMNHTQYVAQNSPADSNGAKDLHQLRMQPSIKV